MARPAQTARSERTRDALRQAALVRFLAQGVEATSAEQIAADAGVSLRTFYRHFASKHDLLFADYDAGLHWFRTALAGPARRRIRSSNPSRRPSSRSRTTATRCTKIAALRADELDPDRIVAHIRQVEADFADAVEARLTGPTARVRRGRRTRKPAYHGRGAMHRRRGVRRRWRSGCSARTDRSPNSPGCAAPGSRSLESGVLRAASFVIIDKTRFGQACDGTARCQHAGFRVRRDRHRRRAQRPDRRGDPAAGRAAHASASTPSCYAGGMASTVELFDGYQFEIAGSVQVPTSADGEPGTRAGHTCRPSIST